MIETRTNDTILAAITGMEFIKNPYTIQTSIPVLRMRNIHKETSFADLVLMVFITCGKKETVVSVPPINPKIVTESMKNSFHRRGSCPALRFNTAIN